jgi:hypothetical protein
MSDTNATPPAKAAQPQWVWIAAAIVLVLVIGGGAWWFLRGGHGMMTASTAKKPTLIGMMGDGMTALDTTMPAQDKLCSTTLTRALDFGVVPAGATLAGDDAQAGQPDGHYTCQAQGSDGKYTLAIDTTCPGSQDKTCYALDSVKRDDGTTTYRRRNWPG